MVSGETKLRMRLHSLQGVEALLVVLGHFRPGYQGKTSILARVAVDLELELGRGERVLGNGMISHM